MTTTFAKISTWTTRALSSEKIFSKKNGWIGIDIDVDQIHLAQVKKQNGQWELQQHQTIDIPIESRNENHGAASSSANSSVIVETLQSKRSLFSLFSNNDAACLLPTQWTELQTMELPRGNTSELNLMIQQEVDAEENEYLFWEESFHSRENYSQQNQHVENDGMSHVTVTSAPKHEILPLAEYLLGESVYCRTISAHPLILARAIQLLGQDYAYSAEAVFLWTSAKPIFAIVQNGVPIFTRVFRNCGFENVVHAVQNQLNINQEEAIQFLKSYNQNGNTDSTNAVSEQISQMMAAPLKQLQKEFEKTLGFIQQKRPELLPQQLWLLGSGAMLCQAVSLVTQLTGVTTKLWQLPGSRSCQAALQARLGMAIALSTLSDERP